MLHDLPSSPSEPAAADPRSSAVTRTAGELRRRILIGRYAIGSSLPGERDLSEELGVSRLTLRAALRTLESEGLVHAVHGSGNRVLDHRESGGLDLFGHLAGLVLSGQPVPGGLDVFSQLMELRRAVAVEAVGLATERASTGELLAMRAHVAELAEKSSDAHAFMVQDLGFARLIVRATKNLAFELLFNSVVKTALGHPGIELAFYANAPATIAVYGRLLDRMEARDAERARNTAARLLYRLDRTTADALSQLLAFTPKAPPTPIPPPKTAKKKSPSKPRTKRSR